MCGLVGIVTKAENGFNYPQQELFEEMLVCDSIRGDDSTGIFGVNKHGNVAYIKLASHPFNLIKTSEYIAWKQDSWNNGRILVGHNRKASSGSISNENAHPFAFGPIILVHNGLIENFRSLLHHRERTKHDVNVDSHAIALLFARNNPIDVIPELKGAFVFIWYNAAEKKLHFVRNEERPLSMVETSDGIYFASEKGMLRWLLRRRANNAEISEFKSGVLLSLDADGKWENQPVKVYEKTPVVMAPIPLREITVDQDGAIRLPVQPKSTTRHLPKVIEMKLDESFNIHYGNDEEVDLGGKELWPQIVFSVHDFKKVSEDHVYPPVWRLWGAAMDSSKIEVQCQFRGSEDEVEVLAYQSYLLAHVSRKITRNDTQVVYAMFPKKCEIITTANSLPITTDHLVYLQTKSKCSCGHVEVNSLEPEDKVFHRSGFTTVVSCKWCLAGTPECKKLCALPGACTYCVDRQKEDSEKAKAVAV